MSENPRRSLRVKLIIGVAAVHLVLMTVFVFDLVERQKDFLLQELTQRAVHHAQIIAATSSSWVIADDLVGMEEVLHSSVERGDVQSALIADPAGRVLAHTERDKIGKYLVDPVAVASMQSGRTAHVYASDENTIHAIAPIKVDGRGIGWSLLSLDKKPTARHLAHVTQTGLVYTVVAILAGTLFAVLLAKSILRQLGLVMMGVDRLGSNRLDQPIAVVSKDEVGTVAMALNDAMSSLRDGREKLRREITERERAEQEIRELARRQTTLVEEERKRIARDLHDELGQALTSVQFGLRSLESAFAPDQTEPRSKCRELAKLVEHMGSSVDMIASDLRPATLDHLGLVFAVQSYLKELADRGFPLKTHFQAIGLKRRLPAAIELACYRIIQEAINNIAKHANAQSAEIRLTMSHPVLILMISDDGIGFQESGAAADEHSAGGLGLLGMKERAAAVGGVLEIRTRKEGGSFIRIEIPITEETPIGQDEGFDR